MSDYLPNRYRCEVITRRGERIARVSDLETGRKAIAKIKRTVSETIQTCVDKLEKECPDE